MTSLSLPMPPESGAARLPNLRSTIVDHWARTLGRTRPARAEGTALVDHWAAAPEPRMEQAPTSAQVAARSAMPAADPWQALARAYVQETGKQSQVLDGDRATNDPWLAIGRAYERAVVEEQAAKRTFAERFQDWRRQRAQARIEAQIQALAGGDVRLLRDLQVARDRAEWREAAA